MGAPEHVPTDPVTTVRSYGSPPRREGSWMARRPGELSGRHPGGERFGVPGPDAGYALTLAARFSERLRLHDGEHEPDVLSGAAAIAMKRAGSFGRAPVIGDVETALVIWGYLDASADADLVALRRAWFEEIHASFHYMDRRRVADAVPAELLLRPLTEIESAYAENWRSCLDLDV